MIRDAWQTLRLVRNARASNHWPPEKRRKSQEDRLKTLLHHAYRTVPIYRRLYDEQGFRPDDFRSLDDLRRIPVLKKDWLLKSNQPDRICRGLAPAGLSSIATSGTTGHPFRVYLSAADACWQRAVAWRILFEHGFRLTDRTLEIRMTPGERFLVQSFGIAPKTWASADDEPEAWLQALARGRHHVVVASAGTLQALAEAAEPHRHNFRPPRLIISDSETLTPTTRALVRRVLGTDPVDVYGLVEVSNFAWQCDERNGFHISDDSHVVEVLAPPGKTGNVVVTALGMSAMPFIRYDTGDVSLLAIEPCPCGRRSPMLQRIYGRSFDAVRLADGRQIFWPVFYEILSAYEYITQWRVIQEAIDRLTVEFVSDRDPAVIRRQIETDLRQMLPDDMTLAITHVVAIDGKPGKQRLVKSNVR
jgi:phenylacetate-CoA ligase